jgi:hypothetical protein
MVTSDVQRLVNALLPLPGVVTSSEQFHDYRYGHLAQCVLSAVFSPNANASAERNVVTQYSRYARLSPIFRPTRETLLPIAQQEPLQEFIDNVDKEGLGRFTVSVLRNEQRTSPTGGIPKAEAAYRFAQVLRSFDIQYLQDVFPFINDEEQLVTKLKEIPGQTYYVTISYFFMLVGSEMHIKLDRMVLQFLENVLRRKMKEKESKALVIEAATLLQPRYPHVTPRILDNCIWGYQRQRSSKNGEH